MRSLRTLRPALSLLSLVLLPAACVNQVGPSPSDPDARVDLPTFEEPPANEEPPAEEPPAEEPPPTDPPPSDPPPSEPPPSEPPPQNITAAGSAPVVCPADDGAGTRAVLVIERGLGGHVRLLQIDDKGILSDTGTSLPLDLPHAVTFRADGLEALVAYGTSSAEKTGVLVLALAPDGSSVTVVQDLDIPADATPRHVSYTSQDSAVVSRIGPGDDDVVPLVRGDDGKLAIGTPWKVPGEWPQQTVGVPGQDHTALLLRANILGPEYTSEVLPVNDAGGAITATGAPLAFDNRQFFLYAHPTAGRAYLHTVDPNDPDELNPAGLLHVIEPDGGGWQTTPAPFPLPDRASMAALGPAGNELVVADPRTDWLTGPTGSQYIGTESYELYSVALDDAGLPIAASDERASFDGILIYGLSVASTGHVVVAWDTGTLIDGVDDAVGVFHVTADGWVQVCGLKDIDGPALVAVAPTP